MRVGVVGCRLWRLLTRVVDEDLFGAKRYGGPWSRLREPTALYRMTMVLEFRRSYEARVDTHAPLTRAIRLQFTYRRPGISVLPLRSQRGQVVGRALSLLQAKTVLEAGQSVFLLHGAEGCRRAKAVSPC